ncbi:thymidine kinase [Pyrobaculum aerophilum]|uniref:Thymidine kinase n=1 Tax=Pyrobaculum aerophilum TaxID=13773 RepID=A0A371R313_9CREN|nr:thymidine kinase [Pyrobaculum aerophilum]RFA95276.1 thymidine kinase [Pyrobaculum aerophilum]RFA98185.1 thymidine kinase [Pyrobaculum aerophilum]
MLVVIVGPMFAGKTTELIRRVERHVIAGRRAIVFKPSLDVRYDASKVAAHNGLKFDAFVIPPDKDGVEIIRKMGAEYDVVAVDEIQFFPVDLADALNQLANGRIVIAAGLNLDFREEPFETTARAMAFADRVISLSAVCKICGKPATRTQRLINGVPAPRHSPRILIGGNESYEARCRRHYVIPP